MKNFNEIFRKIITYNNNDNNDDDNNNNNNNKNKNNNNNNNNNNESHKKAGLDPLSEKYIFGKTTGGVKLNRQPLYG